MESVPGAVATGSQACHLVPTLIETRSLPLPVLTSRATNGFPHNATPRPATRLKRPAIHDLPFTIYCSNDRIRQERLRRRSRLVGTRQSKCEPCRAAIHDEGLPERPIKNSNQTSLSLARRIDYEDES